MQEDVESSALKPSPVPRPARWHFVRPLDVEWPRSELFVAFLSLMMGWLYVWVLVGPTIINPTSIGWLKGDTALYYIAWGAFRQDDVLRWPLTFTTRLGFPVGQSISLLDPVSLWALLLKPFSSVLPATFQYFGLYAIVTFALQFYFSSKLFVLLIGRNFFAVLLPSLFFLTAPPLTLRMTGHFGLTSQWVIVAAIYLYCKANTDQRLDLRCYVGWAVGLAAISLSLNPYLAIMAVAILASSVASLYLQRRMTILQASGAAATIITCAGLTAWVLGFLSMGQGDYGAVGYRYYSLNLLSPFDPNMYGAVFLKQLSHFAEGQYEGYAYFGAGFLALVLALAPSLTQRSVKLRAVLPHSGPLISCCAFLTLFALSTRATAGGLQLYDLDPNESFTRYFSALRSSGRMFWVPFYVIWTYVIAFAFLAWRRNIAITIMGAALLVQWIDLGPLRSAVRQFATLSPRSTLASPVWTSLGKSYANLVVLPAKQCSDYGPGGPDGFRDFGLLALSQHMTVNSYHAGRYDQLSLRYHCEQAIDLLAKQGLAEDSVYVVNSQIALLIAAGPAGPDKCGQIDNFIVCTNRPLPISKYTPETPRLESSGRIDAKNGDSARKYLIRGWHLMEPDLVWSNGEGVVEFRLPDNSTSYRRIRLKLVSLVGPGGTSYRVEYGSHSVAGTLPASAAARLDSFSIELPLRQSRSEDHSLRLIVPNPTSPAALHLGADSRMLGLGLQSLELLR